MMTEGKRKERERGESDDVKVGSRVKVKFDDGVWYEGNVTSIERGKVDEVVRIGIW